MTAELRRAPLAILALALLSPSPAFAEGEEDAFSWHPSLTISNYFDDNPKLEDGGSGDDVAISLLPRLELGFRSPGIALGADLGVEIRRYVETGSLNDEWYRMSGFAELGLLPGLIVRVADDFVPEARQLGLPEDSSANLVQTNRSDAEIRYWRELPMESEFELGVRGTYFLTDDFDAEIPLGGGVNVIDDDFEAEFWQGTTFLQLQTSIGRLSSVFLLGQFGYRDFDDSARSDHMDTSVLLGLRTQRFRSLELEVALGYGRITFDSLSDEQAVIGHGSLRWRLPGGWTWTLAGSNDFATNLAGNEVFQAKGEIELEKQLGEHAIASVGLFLARFDDESFDRGSDLYGGVEVEVAYRFNDHAHAGLNYRYWRNRGDAGFNDYEYNTVGLDFTYRY